MSTSTNVSRDTKKQTCKYERIIFMSRRCGENENSHEESGPLAKSHVGHMEKAHKHKRLTNQHAIFSCFCMAPDCVCVRRHGGISSIRCSFGFKSNKPTSGRNWHSNLLIDNEVSKNCTTFMA